MQRTSIRVWLAALPFLAMLAGCGPIGQAAQHDRPVLLAEAQAICPMQQVDVTGPLGCEFSRVGNGATPSFNSPRHDWGVAYAFNCGSRPQTFGFVERLPGMDHMGLAPTTRHARQGSGYVFITKSQMVSLLNAVPHAYEFDGAYTEVDISSPCTWHVRAVLGSVQDVKSAIPAVPRMGSRWWLKASSQ